MARSLLYRRQILQENIRWKALDEIYKIYMLLHRSDLNISETFRQSFFAFFSKMSKLYRARSRLCRRQILQENMRWKARDEIYKIYVLLHRSDLNISENFRQTFAKLFTHFRKQLIALCSEFDEIFSEFRRYFRKC